MCVKNVCIFPRSTARRSVGVCQQCATEKFNLKHNSERRRRIRTRRGRRRRTGGISSTRTRGISKRRIMSVLRTNSSTL